MDKDRELALNATIQLLRSQKKELEDWMSEFFGGLESYINCYCDRLLDEFKPCPVCMYKSRLETEDK